VQPFIIAKDAVVADGKQSVVAARPSRAQRSVRTAATTKMRLKLSAPSTVQLPRRSSAWRQLPRAIAGIALLGILAFAVMFMVSAWTRTAAQLSVHGWIALTLGVLFSLIVGCGLMALAFYSSRRGYDERAHSPQSHREVP